MKKLMVVVMCLSFAYAAEAQHGHAVVVGGHNGGVYAFQPRVAVGVGFYSPFYSPFGYYGFPYWGLAYGGYFPYGGAYNRSSKLQRKEEDIKSDYADRIYSVRQDSSLTNKQKRQAIRGLKKQRDQEIHDLVANYHKQPVNQENLNGQ
ncbi:MAG TPA: hypothetical protein VII44_01295 [Puia sp.]